MQRGNGKAGVVHRTQDGGQIHALGMGVDVELQSAQLQLHVAVDDAAERVCRKIRRYEGGGIGGGGGPRRYSRRVEPLKMHGNLLGGVSASDGELAVRKMAIAVELDPPIGRGGLAQKRADVLEIEPAPI